MRLLISGHSRRQEFKHIAAILSLSAIAFSFGFVGNARAAGCLRDDRTVKFEDGSSRMRSYICRLENSHAPQLRVEFHRLSETAAGNLLQNFPYPGLEKVLGSPRLLSTPTGIEARKLFDNFGSKQIVSASCFEFSVKTPKGGKNYDGKCDSGERKLAFFTIKTGGAAMPLPDDELHTEKKLTWPSGYNFFYTEPCLNNIIECTHLWRPATQADFDNYKSNRDRQNKLRNIPQDVLASKEAAEQFSSDMRYFRLAEYLMRDGWRNAFLTVTGTYDGCGGLAFWLYTRDLLLDVVAVENLSSAKIKLDGLLGVKSETMALREASSLPKFNAEPVAILADSSTELMPGEKIVAPLRITWRVSENMRQTFRNPAAANRLFDKLRSLQDGKVFKVRDEDNRFIKKLRESFKAPQTPPMEDFVYGPVIDVTGFVSDGERVALNERSLNFVQATVSSEEGSCPFLYAWHADDKSWISYGKIIHKAKSKVKEMTQEVPLTSFATRFRISEEELELSYIDYVALKVGLADGTERLLTANNSLLSEVDERYVYVGAGSFSEIEFTIPEDVKAHAVTRSSLIVRGYYEPYSRIKPGQGPSWLTGSTWNAR